MMDITCPKCNLTRSVSEDQIPETADVAVCPHCQYRFLFRGPQKNGAGSTPHTSDSRSPDPPPHEAASSQAPSTASAPPGRSGPERQAWAPSPLPPATDKDIAWERLDHFPFFKALSRTIKRAMLTPTDFFTHMPLGRGLARPFAFYLLLSTFELLLQAWWIASGIGPGADMVAMPTDTPLSPLALKFLTLAMILVLAPLFLVVRFFVAAGMTHFFLSFFRANSAGFEGTARVVAYSSATSLLAVIPVLGPMAAFPWSLILVVLGCKIVHKAPMSHVLYGLAPLYVLMLVFVVWLQAPFLQ